MIAAADEIVLAANWQVETVDNGVRFAETLARNGKDVSILGVAAFNDAASLSMRLHRIDEPVGGFMFRNIRSKFFRVNARLQEAADQTAAIRFLDKLALFCDRSLRRCDMLAPSGKLAIFDSAHVTVDGVDILSARIVRDGWFE